MLIYENKVPASYRTTFIAKVIQVSKNLGINPNWLMAIMHFETGGSFKASETNKLGYTGLIQFGPGAATDLKTTLTALRNMTAVQQLDYVERYYKMWYKRLKIVAPNSYIDTYLITIFPAAVNKGLDFVIRASNISAAAFEKANPAFDLNNNKEVTVAEIQQVMLKRLPSEWVKDFLKKKALA